MNERYSKNRIFQIMVIFFAMVSCVSGEPKNETLPFASGPVTLSHEGQVKVFYPRHDLLAEYQSEKPSSSNIAQVDSKSTVLGNNRKGWVIRKLSSKTGATSFSKDASLQSNLTQVFSYSDKDGSPLFILPGHVIVIFHGDRDDTAVNSWIKKYKFARFTRITPSIIVVDSQAGIASIEEAEKIQSYDFVKDAYPDISTEKTVK